MSTMQPQGKITLHGVLQAKSVFEVLYDLFSRTKFLASFDVVLSLYVNQCIQFVVHHNATLLVPNYNISHMHGS